MNLVFMNSLAKKAGELEEVHAQIRVVEEHGVWNVVWDESTSQGEVHSECWYNGNSADQMMQSFKQRMTEKLSDGFIPVLEGLEQAFHYDETKGLRTSMLQFYSEQHVNEAAYEKLRQWRSTVASREGIAPFIIGSNRVLQMIATFLPNTHEELESIPGMGPKKVELYGDDMLKLLKGYKRNRAFPLDWVEEEVDPMELRQWIFRLKDQKLKKELSTKQLKQQLLEGALEGQSVESMQQDTGIGRREVIQWLELLDREGYNVHATVSRELEGVDEKEQAKAWAAFMKQGDRHLKPVLEQVYKVDKLKDKELNAAYEWLRLLRIKFKHEQGAMSSSQTG